MMGLGSLDGKHIPLGTGDQSMTAHSQPEIGVPVTIGGEIILPIGGVFLYRED